MNRKELDYRLETLLRKYITYNTSETSYNRFSPIIFELEEKWHNTWVEEAWDCHDGDINMWEAEIPSRVKFTTCYKRKDIMQIFSELGLKVISFTNVYGKTIVHFTS